MFSRLWARIIISQLKRGAIKNESVLRVLIHYLLLEMDKRKASEIDVTYTISDESEYNLLINCRLEKKGGGVR